jgi:diguanylate cyclase (GGDEF)-like protein
LEAAVKTGVHLDAALDAVVMILRRAVAVPHDESPVCSLPSKELAAGAQLVLLIDDDPSVHRLLKDHLREECIELIHALDAPAGEALASARTPDLILLDVRMPVVDGLQLCRRLKRSPATSDIAIVFLSSDNDVAVKVQCFDAGAIDYVVKPFAVAELQARVRAALRLQRYQQMLATQAQIDGLTGLWNRKFFENALERLVAIQKRHSQSFGLLTMDIDHFKKCNDQWGHPFGDRVIQAVSGAIQSSVRTLDRVCRNGGDELTVLLPHTDIAGCEAVAGRIHQTIRLLNLQAAGNRVCVTVSIGIAASDGRMGGGDPGAAIVAAADRALYKAKRHGRDQTHVET